MTFVLKTNRLWRQARPIPLEFCLLTLSILLAYLILSGIVPATDVHYLQPEISEHYCNVAVNFRGHKHAYLDRCWGGDDYCRAYEMPVEKPYKRLYDWQPVNPIRIAPNRLLHCFKAKSTQDICVRPDTISETFANELYKKFILRLHPDKVIAKGGTAFIELEKGRKFFKKHGDSIRDCSGHYANLPGIPKCNTDAVVVEHPLSFLGLQANSELTASSIQRTILVTEMLAVVTICLLWYLRRQLAPMIRRCAFAIPSLLLSCLWSCVKLPSTLTKLLWALIALSWTLASMLWRTNQPSITVVASSTTATAHSTSTQTQPHPFATQTSNHSPHAYSPFHLEPCNHHHPTDTQAYTRRSKAGKQAKPKTAFRREHDTRQHCNCGGELRCRIR